MDAFPLAMNLLYELTCNIFNLSHQVDWNVVLHGIQCNHSFDTGPCFVGERPILDEIWNQIRNVWKRGRESGEC